MAALLGSAQAATVPVLASALAGCGGSSDTISPGSSKPVASGNTAQLALVAYSTAKKAYDALTAAFEQTKAGRGVGFALSFGASGSQSRAVDSGQPADIVAFSTTPDITRLVKDHVVAPNWDANPAHGFSSNSVAVLVVRRGNPKHITGWDDLVRPGIQVITPNPSTSGSARWQILAGYGAQLKEGRTPSQALAYIKTLLTKHVAVQDASASAALRTFTGGKGDVLLDYESDAIAAKKAGEAIDYIIPRQTILIQTPIAVSARSSHGARAQAFLAWQWSAAGQRIWAREGYRPVLRSVAEQYADRFPTPPALFTIAFLGGWSRVQSSFFDPAKGSITKIEQQAGVPTASS